MDSPRIIVTCGQEGERSQVGIFGIKSLLGQGWVCPGDRYVLVRMSRGGGYVQGVGTHPPLGHGTWDTTGYGWQGCCMHLLECFLIVTCGQEGERSSWSTPQDLTIILNETKQNIFEK